MGKQYDWEL